MERTGVLPRALLRFSSQTVFHALLVSIRIQMATLIFFPAPAPTDIVAAYFFLFIGLFLIIEKSFKNFHLNLHPISFVSIDCYGHSPIRIPNSVMQLIPPASASAAPSASEAAAPSAFPPGSAVNAFFFGPGFANRNGVAQ